MPRADLIAELIRDEGDTRDIVDDATGRPIRKGVLVRGVPTLGSGITGPFDQIERAFLLNHRIDLAALGLHRALPWFVSLDDVRQRVLINMAYNLGVAGLLKWHVTLGFVGAGKFEEAANEMLNSHPWIDQVKGRGRRLAEMMRTGVAV